MAGPIPLDTSDPARLGGWELLARLGTGGQGMVYLGRPLDPDARPSRVAVKLLHARLLGDAGARERFVRELALLQRVAGFCTAQMLAADMAGDRPYIVSEYVPGPSLRALVQDRGPRTGADLDRLAISSVTALSAIHRANVAHRDFKPQNVLMGPDGPRVIDFGIARAFDAGATLTSQVVGTPAYMAPEQFAGRAGPAADLFAWAGTLLFAATARDPFAGGPLPAVMYKIMHETPDLSPLPAPLAEVAAACLSKDPSTRPTSEEVLLWLLGHRTPRTAAKPAPPAVPAQNPAAPADSGPTLHHEAPDAADTALNPGVHHERGWSADGPSDPAQAPATAVDRGTMPYGSAAGGAGAAFAPGVQPGRGWSAGAPSDPAQAPATAAEPGPDPGTAPYGEAGAAFNPGVQQGWAWSAGSPPGSAQGAGTAADPATAPHGDAPGGAGGPAGPGTAPYGGGARRLRRGAALAGGLVLAGVLAALDVAALAILIARPGLSEGHRGGLLPVVASSFAVVAVVTLVAVILAWRGSRSAAWTVLAARVVRVAMWGAWGALVQVQASALAGHAVLTAVVVVLLARGLSRS
ncbi:serine/threonine-protein kinase [Actinomadura chokoriensis]|uniref:serine/threonine-protein kinase n=1 Tax=Actinomadura chokoriensis TaxID=454156 RepID=UPI0031F8AD36